MLYQNKIYGFLPQVPTTPLTLPNIVCIKIPFFFFNLYFWATPSFLIMIQNQQEFKIQTNKVP